MQSGQFESEKLRLRLSHLHNTISRIESTVFFSSRIKKSKYVEANQPKNRKALFKAFIEFIVFRNFLVLTRCSISLKIPALSDTFDASAIYFFFFILIFFSGLSRFTKLIVRNNRYEIIVLARKLPQAYSTDFLIIYVK
jgi:hypothetical protein